MMKVEHQLERLVPMILGPLDGLNGSDWHRAPSKKWTVCQILDHLAMSVDIVAGAFERRIDRPPMERRATPHQTIVRHLLLGVGRIPTGIESPESVVPNEQPDADLVMARFRMGVERHATLVNTWPMQRQLEVFVRHPLAGDLNLPEWVRFHYVHGKHHALQIETLLDWMKHEAAT